MFGFKNNPENSVPRPSLYCVWIRAHEGEDAPLIRVWIDPSMTMFESQATVHQPDLEAARAQMEPALLPAGCPSKLRASERSPHPSGQSKL